MVAICSWGGRRELTALFNAVSEPAAGPPRVNLGKPGVLEELLAGVGLTPRRAADVETPYESPDLATLVSALRDASGFERATPEVVARAAAPHRRPDGSYRFENRFRYVVATRS
jgi:hypothetical protein